MPRFYFDLGANGEPMSFPRNFTPWIVLKMSQSNHKVNSVAKVFTQISFELAEYLLVRYYFALLVFVYNLLFFVDKLQRRDFNRFIRKPKDL